MVARIPVPERKTVTGNFYAEQVLPAFVNHYTTTRPRTGMRGMKLLHDNAPAYCSAVVQDYFKTQGLKTLPHPAYSPDLSPCDFWLNPLIKKCPSGRKFETRTAVGTALYQCFNSIAKSDTKNAFSDQKAEKVCRGQGWLLRGTELIRFWKVSVFWILHSILQDFPNVPRTC